MIVYNSRWTSVWEEIILMTGLPEWQFIEEMINMGKSILFLRKQGINESVPCILTKLYVKLFIGEIITNQIDFTFQNLTRNHHLAQKRES